jgi:hypothetical protein
MGNLYFQNEIIDLSRKDNKFIIRKLRLKKQLK